MICRIVIFLTLLFLQPALAEPVTMPLLLADVLQQVEQNHPKLQGAELERRMAAAKRLEKQGAFDTILSYENDSQRYNSYPKRGDAKEETLNDISLGKLTRYGAKVSLGSSFHYGKIKSPASGTGELGTHSLSLQLPLLRGARINDKNAAEQKALLGEPLANAEFNQYRLGLLLRASDYYWQWAADKLKQNVAQSMLQLAQTRALQIEARVKAGDLPRITSIEAQQECQKRQEQLFKAQREFQKSTFALSTYLWNSAATNTVAPTSQQAPDTLPEPKPLQADDLAQAKLAALKYRPEIAQLALSKDINDIDLSLAKNQLLPILDVYLSPGLDTGEQSIGPTLKAGVALLLPIQNRSARGQVEQAKLKLQKLNLDQKALLQQILIEVEDTWSELSLAYQRHVSAKQAYQLATELEAGERTRFELGDGTLFLVNQREQATAEALSKQIDLQADYQQAQVRLLAVTSQL